MKNGKIDLKRRYSDLYSAPRYFVEVTAPTLTYLVVEGMGDPNVSPAYAEAVESLYAVSYAVKFASKQAGRDYVVAPLEGLWTAPDLAVFTERDKSAWHWTMMILQPDWIDAPMVAKARADVAAKKGLAAEVELRSLTEGRCVQVLHMGPYDDEAPLLDRLHREYMPEHGLTFAGPHHEIYLSDPRRVAPTKLRTILRQPVRPLDAVPSR